MTGRTGCHGCMLSKEIVMQFVTAFTQSNLVETKGVPPKPDPMVCRVKVNTNVLRIQKIDLNDALICETIYRKNFL